MSARRSQSGSNFRRLVGNLTRDKAAMSLLASRGIDAQMVQAVGMGLKEPYVRADGTRVENVLAFPLATEAGRRRYAYLNIDGHTLNPEHPVGWGPGRPETVRAGEGRDILVVCASAVEVWQVQRAAYSGLIDLTAVCSSQPGRLPAEWLKPEFWLPWGRVVALESVSLGTARAIAGAGGRPVERVDRPFVDGAWSTDREMSTALVALLGDAAPVGAASADALLADTTHSGDFAAAPISIHGGISEGRGFYAFTVERRELVGGSNQTLHRYQTLVLRSDGAVLEPLVLPAPRGTPAHRRVHALSDGTRIMAFQDPGHHCSWTLAGIRRFVAARQAGTDPSDRQPEELANAAVAHLRKVAALPQERDYWILTAFVFATYVFRLFDALPIVHVHGDKGSGKSELTAAVVSLGFNGRTMSQGSAPALVRLVKEAGGLIALDDAEALAGGGGEIGQALKQGYKQATAVKVIVHPSGRTEAIDFFGPRVISNTLGLDPIIGSRAIRIATRQSVLADNCSVVGGLDIADWRDAVHAFAMSRLGEFADAYEEVRREVRDRHGEIWAPLRAVARVLGDAEMIAAVA